VLGTLTMGNFFDRIYDNWELASGEMSIENV
jgi:hypothetical protein